jgi:aspartate aminotransferase
LSLADLGDSISYSIFGRVSEMAAEGRKVYPLAIGEPSFTTPRRIMDEAYESMKRGDTHYVSSFGTQAVREAISEKAQKHNGIGAQVRNTIFLTTKLSVYAAVLASGQGGEVLIPDPGYFYQQPVSLAGSKPVRYRLAPDYSIDLDEVEKSTTSKTRALIVNTPSNPTGKMHGKSELEGLLDLARRKKFVLISDESYEDLTYSKKHFSVGSLEPEPDAVMSLFSLSKSFAMTGWRAGYTVASVEKVKMMNRFIEHTMSCFPPFIEAAAAYALRKGAGYTERFRAELLARRGMLESRMKRVPRLHYLRTEGAFYSFPEYDAPMTSVAFCQKLLDATGVAVLPGSIFGPAGEGHVRISFAAPRETIDQGMRLLGGFLEGLRR